jgi:hypothetical protein
VSEPTVVVLRESVRRAVAASSLRAVAEQVGLTHRGLALFIEGTRPRPGTIRKLTTWFANRPADAEGVSPELAEAALAVLFAGLPAARVEEPIRNLLSAIRQICESAGLPPPAWLAPVLARHR